MDFHHADVVIQTWNQSTIKVSGQVNINNNQYNDHFEIAKKQSGNKLYIETFVRDKDKLPKMTVVERDGIKYYFEGEMDWKKDLKKIEAKLGKGDNNMISNGVFVDAQLTITIPEGMVLNIDATYGDLVLKQVPAKTKVSCTYGSIEASFDRNQSFEDVNLHSTYDFVEVRLSNKMKAELDLESDFGKILTNLDFQIDKSRSTDKSFASHIVGTLNGGGPRLRLKADYSDIYLRAQ